MPNNKHGFKVLRKNLKSLGILGAPLKQYYFNIWNKAEKPLSPHPKKGGGIWLAKTLRDARKLQKYVLKTRGIKTRIFYCKIGKIIFQTSGRIKTNKIFFGKNNEIL